MVCGSRARVKSCRIISRLRGLVWFIRGKVRRVGGRCTG